jgi:hypothetical protein
MPRTRVKHDSEKQSSRNGARGGRPVKGGRHDVRAYLRSRTNFPIATLAKFAGQWIAWSPDGKRIIANAADEASLDALICRAGEDPSQCIVEGIPAVGEAVLGGASLDAGYS